MSTRHTYTVLIPGFSLTPRSHRNIARVDRAYFDTKRELLDFLRHTAKVTGRKLHVAVHSYVPLNKGLGGYGKLLDYATFTPESGLVLHGLTPARESMLRRYIPGLRLNLCR